MSERVAAQPKRAPARFLVPALLVVLVVLGGSFAAIARFVPPRIREPSEIAPSLRTIDARAQAGVLHFGVPPVLDDETSHLVYAPLAQHLTRATSRDVRLYSADTYSELGRELADGTLDAALLPPLAYAVARRHGGAELLAQARSDEGATYASVIVARGDRRTLADLRGARVAFTSPDSLSGYLAPATELRRAGVGTLDLGERIFAGDHARALALLSRGEVDAAATYDALHTTFARTHPDTHVLARVEDLPNDLVATHPTLDATSKRALANALASLPPDVTTRLAELGIVAFEPARAEDLTALDVWTEAW
jgi:phosphonate transport system substrate-binding protein